MTISRRKLYASGEPLGDCATRKKTGGGYVCGGGGGSSSSASTSNTSNTSTATDNRMALGEGGIGASGGSTVNNATTYNSQDPGALRSMELAMMGNTAVSANAVDKMAGLSTDALIANSMVAGNAIDGMGGVSMFAIDMAGKTAQAAAASAAAASSSAISSATTSQRQALDFAAGANATNAEGFGKLLDTASDMFNSTAGAIREATTDGFNLVNATNGGLKDAYAQAVAEKSGALDNKTIMVIAVAGAAALAFMSRGK